MEAWREGAVRGKIAGIGCCSQQLRKGCIVVVCLCRAFLFFQGFCGFAEVCRVATITSRKNKRPRVISNDEEEEVLEGHYYHASIEQRAVIWRAVSDEKPIIVKNISNFWNYFWKIQIFCRIFESKIKIVNFWTYDRGPKNEI